jgi:PAS domain S-box-containing protein
MMPRMDGFQLLSAIRNDETLKGVPVIVLSARAGEEASLEGLSAGADVYLVKPFSARELLAHVGAQLALARLRRETEQALRNNEERYRKLIGLLPIAVYTCEAPSGIITFYNDHAAKLWGRAPSAGATDERFCGSFKLWWPDGRALPRDQTPMAVAVREGREFRNEEVVIERADGTRITVLVNIDPIRDVDGRVVGAINAFHDTSALKQAEAALRESEERFRLVARAANDVIWEIDLDKDRVWWSEAMQGVFGYALKESGLDTSWYYEHIHPDDRDRVVQGMADVIGGEAQIWSDEFRYRRADGTYAYVIDRAYVARDATEKAVRIIGSMRDISERKRAEEKLRRSEDQLAGILRQASVGIAQVDTAGCFVLVNDRYCEIAGRAREELLGLRMQDITHPDDVERNLVLFQNTAKTGEDFEIEKRYVRPDGSFVWVHNSVYAVRNVRGGIEHLVAVSLDITERKHAQERLEELNSLLETRVAERTGDLLRAIAERERLQDQLLQAQKMESVGTLASGVAHDFNNLLNIISSYAAIMRLDGKNPAAISEGVSVIDETVRRGAALVQQLMTLGRRSETRSEPVGLNSVAEKLANLLSETFSKAIVITLDLERGLPAIRGDENQLHQALLNLCVNARDAMPKGGRISLKTATVSGEELWHRQPEAVANSYAVVSVSDSGSGMDEAIRRRIFEPFFTTKPVGEGSGLGLAVVYGIVKNHAGFIEVESRIGRGTTFSIYLPIPAATSEQISERGPSDKSPKPEGRGETILFVDDEERQLNIMRRFLESEGYRVLVARDGLEALEIFKRHKEEIAVAVLDLGLPRLGGWPAFQQMREIRPGLKVIVASGFVSTDVEAELAQGKLGGIIAKPYQLDDVLEKLSQAIHHAPA